MACLDVVVVLGRFWFAELDFIGIVKLLASFWC
jgi:hypothetical protein